MAEVRVTFLGTGAGACIHRAHTAIAIDCADGTRLLLDASSGNSALRHGAALGLLAEDFHHVLLSHHHPDHIEGLPHLEFRRSRVNPEGPPLNVYATEETLEGVRRLYRAVGGSVSVDQDGGWRGDGQQVLRWRPVQEGQRLELGPTTCAIPFAVDHLSGAIGWRVESDGITVAFSGDTRFSPNLVAATQGVRLLIHEAMCVDRDKEAATRVGHSTSADAGRAATLAGASELIITHIDNPYHFDPQPLLDDARGHFGGPVSVASDLHQVTIATG